MTSAVFSAFRGPVEPLRVPAAAVLLAGGRVLRAAQVAAPDRARVAGVAADALAHLVVAALLDLARQERVGDRRPGGADQVDRAAPHDLGHPVGVGEAADDDDRLLRRLPGLPRPLELVALLEEPRRPAVDPLPPRERADRHVPEVDHGVGPADELEAFGQLDPRASRACRPRSAPRWRSRRRRRRGRARSPPARTVTGSRTSRRSRPCGGCRWARGTGSAGRCATRTRRRCRSRRRAPAGPRPPTRPAPGRCPTGASPWEP